jgi:hypothetical protein
MSLSRFQVVHLARFDASVDRARADVRNCGGLIGREHCYLTVTVRAPAEDRRPSPLHYNEPALFDRDLDSSLRIFHRLSIGIGPPRSKIIPGFPICIAPSVALR